MSRWQPLTLETINAVGVDALVQALRTKALAEGQGDTLPVAIRNTTDELRASIAFSGKYKLDANPDALPASFADVAARHVKAIMKKRLMALNEDEKTEEARYDKLRDKLNAGDWPVEEPDTPLGTSPVQSGGSSQVVSSSRRQATSQSLRGI